MVKHARQHKEALRSLPFHSISRCVFSLSPSIRRKNFHNDCFIFHIEI